MELDKEEMMRSLGLEQIPDPTECLIRAYRNALNSPDPSTQNGSFLPIPMRTGGWCSPVDAWTDFPQNVLPLEERLNDRNTKYAFVEHAERNAIYLAARAGLPLEGATLYVPWFACADCSRAIIQTGIVRVVGHQRMFDATPERWKDSVKHGFQMFKEAGVQTELIGGKLHLPPIRFNGELWEP